jgi:hypothetical protein
VTYPNQLYAVKMATLADNVQISGSTAVDVAPTATGTSGGTINVQNNGAHVAATQTGTGHIGIVNNGGPLTATNTGTGTMTINSDASAAMGMLPIPTNCLPTRRWRCWPSRCLVQILPE